MSQPNLADASKSSVISTYRRIIYDKSNSIYAEFTVACHQPLVVQFMVKHDEAAHFIVDQSTRYISLMSPISLFFVINFDN